MKKIVLITAMTALVLTLLSCRETEQKTEVNNWIVDKFDDTRILRYEVPGFEELPLQQKLYVYYLNQAALSGRDILFDQNGEYNIAIRRVIEAIYEHAKVDKNGEEWKEFEKYLKKVWFANGIHHHYSMDKFQPKFSEEYFDALIESIPSERLPESYGAKDELMALIKPIIFDPAVMPIRVNQKAGEDLLLTSAMNYYQGVTQKEAENFYSPKIMRAGKRPIPYGLNSTLVKRDGRLVEDVWRVGGKYSAAIEEVVKWLEGAVEHADPTQKEIIEKLVEYYRTGELKTYDEYSVLWTKDTESKIDFVNGFTEVYGDPLGYKASWEAIVNIKSDDATKRTDVISANAQWFEDNSPVEPKYKKAEVKGVSAKVINVTILGGDCYPASPLGINLPNSDWIRKEYGSKSVSIENISNAYNEASKGNGFMEEFMLREDDRRRIEKYGKLADNLHTDLHECLGHGSGQLAPGVRGDELANYGSAIEEARADLFALYYIADPKMIELGVVPTLDVAWAEYARYIMNGMMTQLARIDLGKDVEQAHMRNRKLIAEWCYEQGRKDNVIEKVVENGKTYVVINDFEKLRELFGKMLRLIQNVKSEGSFNGAKNLIETYAVKIDQQFHKEIKERYDELGIEPYAGFVNPVYKPVMVGGDIVDVVIDFNVGYAEQMLDYSKNYSFLPSRN